MLSDEICGRGKRMHLPVTAASHANRQAESAIGLRRKDNSHGQVLADNLLARRKCDDLELGQGSCATAVPNLWMVGWQAAGFLVLVAATRSYLGFLGGNLHGSLAAALSSWSGRVAGTATTAAGRVSSRTEAKRLDVTVWAPALQTRNSSDERQYRCQPDLADPCYSAECRHLVRSLFDYPSFVKSGQSQPAETSTEEAGEVDSLGTTAPQNSSEAGIPQAFWFVSPIQETSANPITFHLGHISPASSLRLKRERSHGVCQGMAALAKDRIVPAVFRCPFLGMFCHPS